MVCVSASLHASAANPTAQLGAELRAKRDALVGFHQEFEITQTNKTAQGDESFKRNAFIDVARGAWRERAVTGSGNYVAIFDGDQTFLMEEGGTEYTRTARHGKGDAPQPSPYSIADPDWSRAREARRGPCGFRQNDHACVVIDAPVKPWLHVNTTSSQTRMLDGTVRMVLDLETGLLISMRAVQNVQSASLTYQSDITVKLKSMTYGMTPEESLFKLPAGLQEVRELSRWDAGKIKKQLTGKPAPELAVHDMSGKPVSLASFKGKTVLLDFWTTWCPSCRQDGSALEKLYTKYNQKDLIIVGFSVNEDRKLVEKFLGEHPHTYPIVLTSENEMPRPYQISVFPTYIVIDPDGTVEFAVEGDQGFGELRKLLKKAGLDAD